MYEKEPTHQNINMERKREGNLFCWYFHWLFWFSIYTHSYNNPWWHHFLSTIDKLEICWYQHHQVASFMWSTKPTSEPLLSSLNILDSGINENSNISY